MNVVVLISCMYQTDSSIIEKSNVQTDVIVVNQCDKDSVDEFNFKNKKGEICHAKFINTTERGLSRSRNMAIRNAWGDICQISDDDETFPDNHCEVINEAYAKHPTAGIITFALNRKDGDTTIYAQSEFKHNLKSILQTSSQQITFSLNRIKENNISFDEMMGSGTGNGGGEENHFLLDCKRAGIKMWYSPEIIAAINPGTSKWFKGYTEKYFRDRGWTSRRNLGFFIGYLFLIFNAIKHKESFTKDGLTWRIVLKNMTLGFFEKR